MFSNYVIRPGRWSLTLRLTVFFAVAISVIVLGVSAMMYAELVHQLHDKAETELLEDLHDQEKVLPSAPQGHDPQDDNAEFAWLSIDARGTVRAMSASARSLPAHLGQTLAPGRFARMTVAADKRARTFLVMNLPARDGAGVLRGVLDVSQDERIKQRYLGKLLLVLVAAIGIAVGIGWLLVWRALGPVRAISTEIGRINAERLHTRLAQEAWPTELRSLAETFDAMLARIERSFEQLSRFSSDLAHEFRSPINNLVAAASVTLGRERSAQEYQAALAVTVEEGGRLSRMVSSMLFLARADNARQMLTIETLKTDAEFARLVAFFDIAAEENGVRLVASGALTLRADSMLLRQALSNLLANALRYTARGGLITLAAEERDQHVVLSVTDSGSGIAAQHLPFLFDRFYRADAARGGADGTGLGLAVVRSIAQLHGGHVSVHSVPGEGSRFELWLARITKL